VQVRYARDFRDSPQAIGRLLVSGAEGVQVPLSQVAQIAFAPGPSMIRSENGYLNDLVSIDVRGRDVGSYVDEARQIVQREVKLSPGYRLEWSGQYEAIQRVKSRLEVVVPLTIAIIALLLYLTFGTVTQMLMVMLSLPFALIGGVWLMWLLDYNLSVAVAVGFIALAGVAAETGVVMLLYLDHAWEEAVEPARSAAKGYDGTAVKGTPLSPTGLPPYRLTVDELIQAIEHGAVNRLRPKLMTVAAIMLGLLPALWAHGSGAEVMQRIAAPMVGGMITSTILTLVVIPVLYFLWRRRGLDSHRGNHPPRL
jgi:Cu(I)/Ag(I) efflux system membrane protein CusA/SilA